MKPIKKAPKIKESPQYTRDPKTTPLKVVSDIEYLSSEILWGHQFQKTLDKYIEDFLEKSQDLWEEYDKCFKNLFEEYGETATTDAKVKLMAKALQRELW
jgi:hypothetical protein